ncbi:MAG: TRAP transporter small permease subunit [Alphaproteobacteria bacterium]|jgi:TRAP-type C4-dicarboxylate transport system permease small subunit
MVGGLGASAAPGEGGLLGAVDRAVARVENIFNGIGAAFIVIVMIYMCCEVLSRKFLGRPLPGVIDWVELAMGTFAFLGAAYCQRVGGHVRMELVVGRLRGRILWALESVAVSIALFYICVIVYKSFTEDFMWAFTLGDSTMDIELPVWPSKLLVPIALSLLAIRLSVNLWGYLRLFLDPTKTPLAVPLIKTAADVAREEIEDAMGSDAKDLAKAPDVQR